ncbi:MAG: DUF4878 domain-containing protein [Gordonia sp.]|nr:DUF4878 domain-containing protein [Gordonia sp. (in: high G+C Gram-positive bacteria)]
MNIRKSMATAALIGLAAFGAAACSDDSTSDSSTATSSVATETSAEASTSSSSDAGGDTASALEATEAQTTLRTVLSPDTDPAESAKLVDSTDPGIGMQLSGLARGFTAAGYTPDKFTVTTVTADGADSATANVEVASPHTPAPVAMPVTFVNAGGQWKLSSTSIADLASMGSSHGG